jgi:hypothetical protein
MWEDGALWEAVQRNQPTPALTFPTLKRLKAELRNLVPAIHEVVDRAHAARELRAHAQTRRAREAAEGAKGVRVDSVLGPLESYAPEDGRASPLDAEEGGAESSEDARRARLEHVLALSEELRALRREKSAAGAPTASLSLAKIVQLRTKIALLHDDHGTAGRARRDAPSLSR